MAIDEDEIEDDEDEDETPAKKGKKGKKPPTKAPPPAKRVSRSGAAVAGSVDASMNGGHRDMPPKAKVSGARARTFKNWVSGLAHREMPPAHFVCELSDGNEKTIPLQENKSGSAYLINECIQTIESYDPVKVEAIFVDEDDKEMSLGQWVFPKAPEAEATEAVAGPTGAPIAPGYFLSEDDSSVERMVKTCVHMIADAYRYNLEAMARVMETQANAFSKERESMTRAMQAAEKTARIKANSKFRVAAGIPNASDAAAGHEDLEEQEIDDGGNNELMKVMFDAVGREIAKKMSGEVPHTAPPPSTTP
jgi:hypothetical protein